MWLRKLVGLVMIVTCLGMNALVLVGVFSPVKVSNVGFSEKPVITAPTVTLTAKPGAISAGGYSALSWSTTGNPNSCTASGDWRGPKTAFGAESTGRITKVGKHTYTISCSNEGGVSEAQISIIVGPASAPPPTTAHTNSDGAATSTSGPTYCGGASPCYGPREVANHNGKGDCWGWNGNRVINISGLDTGFHKAKSGIGTIEISQICGKDLAPSLSGNVSADGQTRNHNPTTKVNADANERPYFVGYFDKTKP